MGRQHPGSFRVLSNQLVREAVKQLTVPAAPIPPVSESSVSASTPSSHLNGNAKRNGAGYLESSARKKRKTTDDLGEIVSYTKANLPADLRKYYAHRYSLFSRYDEGIQMDRESWWSVTPEDIAAHIAERCRCDVIIDAFCGAGGNAIQFAFTCEKVIAIDINPVRLACAKHNAEVYGVGDRIEFICADFLTWAANIAGSGLDPPAEVVFLSPPWGGIDYRSPRKPYFEPGDRIGSLPAAESSRNFDLGKLEPLPAADLVALARTLAPEVALYLPKTTNLAQVANLAPEEIVEVEQQFIGDHFKAVTAYFGDLAQPPPA